MCRVDRIVLGLIPLSMMVSCSSEDSYATLDVLIVHQDAQCVDGLCHDEDQPVPATRVFALALESVDASSFGESGLRVIALWEVEERWVEFEFDVPTDWVGYPDLDIRYQEFVEGVEVFSAREIQGRIVLVIAESSTLPAAASIELRMEGSGDNVRLLHLGALDPEFESDVAAPGPLERPIVWDRDGVELLILDPSVADARDDPLAYEDTPFEYRFDDHEDISSDRTISFDEGSGCSGHSGSSCGRVEWYEEPGGEGTDCSTSGLHFQDCASFFGGALSSACDGCEEDPENPHARRRSPSLGWASAVLPFAVAFTFMRFIRR